jgi:hypothetical protein
MPIISRLAKETPPAALYTYDNSLQPVRIAAPAAALDLAKRPS